jgi:hypothetical protein
VADLLQTDARVTSASLPEIAQVAWEQLLWVVIHPKAFLEYFF